jgi:tetratricopeptide (TPR) repeat protein
VRESIELDASAPFFDRGMNFIDAGRLQEARAYWEAMLARRPESAPLLYNIAAVSEAAGDLGAACHYLERAMMAAPRERRYRLAMDSLRRRNQ